MIRANAGLGLGLMHQLHFGVNIFNPVGTRVRLRVKLRLGLVVRLGLGLGHG